jgi:hypothetical protein
LRHSRLGSDAPHVDLVRQDVRRVGSVASAFTLGQNLFRRLFQIPAEPGTGPNILP